MILDCPICGCEFEISTGHYNRAQKLGLNNYCGKVCSGIGRRVSKTAEQKKKEKAKYDKQYREKNIEAKTKKAKAYYENNKPEILKKMRVYRKRTMPRHVEYCRQPKYKAYKKDYDKQYRAKKLFGDYWESAIILTELEAEYDNREAFKQNKFHNKNAQKRKRQWKS